MDESHIKKILNKFLYSVLSNINSLIPKKKRIFINSGTRLYDNNEVMFEYLLKNTNYNVVCTSNQHVNYELRNGVKVVKYTHLTTIYYMLTSLVIVDSFLRAIKIKPKGKQISIQLWHGTPFKFGGLDEKDRISEYYTHIACPSENYIYLSKKLFSSNGNNVFINGNPRNDLLKEPYLGNFVKRKNEKYIIWLPTYRCGLGHIESTKDLPVLNSNNIGELNECLVRNNTKLFIKPHPLQEKSFDLLTTSLSNIILINDKMLFNQNVALYRFIGGMDALLTDYSSVFYDFLLLNRPIGFVIDDIDEYRDGRGFMFDDPLSMMPGMKIYNIDDLTKFISDINVKDEYKSDRKRINDFANKFQDYKNRERVLDIIRSVM